MPTTITPITPTQRRGESFVWPNPSGILEKTEFDGETKFGTLLRLGDPTTLVGSKCVMRDLWFRRGKGVTRPSGGLLPAGLEHVLEIYNLQNSDAFVMRSEANEAANGALIAYGTKNLNWRGCYMTACKEVAVTIDTLGATQRTSKITIDGGLTERTSVGIKVADAEVVRILGMALNTDVAVLLTKGTGRISAQGQVVTAGPSRVMIGGCTGNTPRGVVSDHKVDVTDLGGNSLPWNLFPGSRRLDGYGNVLQTF